MRPTKIKTIPCDKCGVYLMPYYLKNGVCNGCINPHLVVTSVTVVESEFETESGDNRAILLYPESL